MNAPKEFERALKKAGVDVKDLKKVKGYLSPTCRIIFDLDGKQVTTIDEEYIKEPGEIGLGEHTIKYSEVVHITRGIPKYYRYVVENARNLGRKVAFDPSEEIFYGYDADLFEYMIKRTNYFFATVKECEHALDLLCMNEPDDLLLFTDAVIIFDNKERVVYSKKDKIILPIEDKNDRKYSADLFRAGFYAGLSRGLSIKDSAEIGNYIANFKNKKEDEDSIPTWDEVAKALRYLNKKVDSQ
jgi:sugar/nucleoside kinase (ribokinase family)